MARPLRRLALAGMVAGVGLGATATPALGLIAAYDHYIPGQGFELGLVDVGTGEEIDLPSGVNTSADELHPTLSADGRYLAFEREQILPTFAGIVLRPVTRSVIVLDRSNGQMSAVSDTTGTFGAGAGSPSLSPNGERLLLGGSPALLGLTPSPHAGDKAVQLSGIASPPPAFASQTQLDDPLLGMPIDFDPNDTLTSLTDPHVVDTANPSQLDDEQRAAWTNIERRASNGTIRRIEIEVNKLHDVSGLNYVIGGPFGVGANHPAVRPGDRYTVFDRFVYDPETNPPPGVGTPNLGALNFQTGQREQAPSEVNSNEEERMPAWAPDGFSLGFVRTDEDGNRRLFVYDLTFGIQQIVSGPIPLGDPTPNPETGSLRDHHNLFGNISLAEQSFGTTFAAGRNTGRVVSCNILCIRNVRNGSKLQPSVLLRRGQRVEAVVARVVGRQRLLGKIAPRIQRVGVVQLAGDTVGRTTRRRLASGWNLRVGGRPLSPGNYLITFVTRNKQGSRFVDSSNSISLRVTKTQVQRVAPK